MGTVVGTRGRIRTCCGALNRRLRCRFATLVEERESGVPARATPWGITGLTHVVSEYRPGVAPGSLAWKARSSLLGQRYTKVANVDGAGIFRLRDGSAPQSTFGSNEPFERA